MTSEERDLITRFIERIGGAQGTPGFGSAPGAAQTLPPIDKEADALIAELFQKYPEARYRLTQYAFVQEQALAAAQSRIKQLEQEVQQARQVAQEAPRRSGGFFSNLFGGGSQPSQAPQPGSAWGGGQQRYQGPPQPPPAYPQPQYAPGYQPGMFQPSGTGFLGSALRTAAGVAGGVVLGNALMDMFSSHSAHAEGLGSAALGEAGLGGAAGAAGAAAASPWGSPGAGSDQGYVDQGGWNTDAGTPDQSWDSSSSSDQGGWTDTSSSSTDQGGGWDTGGGDSGWDSGGGGWDSGGSSDNTV